MENFRFLESFHLIILLIEGTKCKFYTEIEFFEQLFDCPSNIDVYKSFETTKI